MIYCTKVRVNSAKRPYYYNAVKPLLPPNTSRYFFGRRKRFVYVTFIDCFIISYSYFNILFEVIFKLSSYGILVHVGT